MQRRRVAQHLFAREVLLAQRALHGGDDVRVGGDVALAHVVAGEQAGAGFYERHAQQLPQCAHVALRDGVFVHIGVHGRGDDDGGFCGHDGGGEHVIRHACGHFSQEICAGRCNKEHICPLGERNVFHFPLVRPSKHVHHGGVARQGLHGLLRDEIERVFRQDAVDVRTLLGHIPRDLRCTVGGDAARHAQNDVFILQHRQAFLSMNQSSALS